MLRAPHSICHKVKTWRYRLSLSYLALRYLSRAAAVRGAEMNGGSPYELPLRGVGVGPPFMGEVAVTITYVSDRARLDVDNIPKPILDALIDLVYADDRQVADLVCRRRSPDPNLRIRNASPLFYESFRAGGQFLHVMVGNAQVQEVIF